MIFKKTAGFLSDIAEKIFGGGCFVVLNYHSVGDGRAPLSVSSGDFRKQMEFLKRNKIKVLSVGEFASAPERGERASGKNVLITFDDGYKDIAKNALPVLKEFGFPSAVFMNPLFTGGWASFASREEDREREICSLNEFKALQAGGMDVCNHGFSHKYWSALGGKEAAEEYTEARDWLLENVPSSRADVFAYPKGDLGSEGENILKREGAAMAFAGGDMPADLKGEKFAIPRVTVHSDWSIWDFKMSLNKFYLRLKKNRSFVLSASALVLLKIVLGVLLLYGIPDLAVGDFLFSPAGGDDLSYVRSAGSILSGDFNFTSIIGFPLYLSGLMLLSGFRGLPEIAAPAVLANIFILGPLALVFSMAAVEVIFRRSSYTALSGILFLAFPYLWFFLFKDFFLVTALGAIDPIGFTRSRHLFGLSVLSDWLSAVLFYAGLLFYLLPSSGGRSRPALSGFLFGLAIMTRVQNVIPALLLGLVLFVFRRFKDSFKFALGAALGLLPQLLHNAYMTGRPWLFADYLPEFNKGLSESTFGFHNLLSLPERIYRYSPAVLAILAVLSLVFTILSLLYFRKKKEAFLAVLFAGILSPLSLFLFDSSVRNPRYFLPFIPLFLAVFWAALEYVFGKRTISSVRRL